MFGRWWNENNKWIMRVLYKIGMKWIDNNIGESGARIISEALKRNSTLTKLSLWSDEMKIINE